MNTDIEIEKIAIIDDDPAVLKSCSQVLTKEGFLVETYEDGVKGLEGVAEMKPDLVVVDLKMPGISGMEVISRINKMDPYVTIAVITGYASIDTAVEAMKSGADDFLPKPVEKNRFTEIMEKWLEVES